MRGPNPIRGLKQAVENRTELPSRTAYLEDIPNTLLKELYLPQIALESEQSAKVTREVCLYYRKKLTGRRCSCFTVETSPEGACQICYGAGYVGGWDLHGCRTEIIDVTSPALKMVNIMPNFEEGMRPVSFVLEPGCKTGYIETQIDLVRNVKQVQKIQLVAGNVRKGSSYAAFIMAPSDLSKLTVDQARRLGEEARALADQLQARLGPASPF